MSESYRALCSDFYVNQKLSVKLELPRSRETVLDLFERVRRRFKSMSAFRRYKDELALESDPRESLNRWIAIRANNIRSGVVNPDTLEEAYTLHRHILEVAPYFLNISPLDVDFIEVLYGFDLSAVGNHDAIVFDALLSGSPLSRLMDIRDATPIDCQPMFGMTLPDRCEAHFEVKTRSQGRSREPEASAEPISIYLTVRKYGPVSDIKELDQMLTVMVGHGEELVESRLVPTLLVPIRESIVSSGNA